MTNWKKRYLKPVLATTLIMMLTLTVIGCEDFGTFAPPEPPQEEPEKPAPTTFITSDDRATRAVYEHLLSLAESHEAKKYLAEFSAASDNWSAKSELFKDGTSIWYVVVNMSGVEEWEETSHWQQAGWFVYQEGKVIPSNRLQANALRIEADLQELSLSPAP